MLKEMGKIRRKENKKATARRTREKDSGDSKERGGREQFAFKASVPFLLAIFPSSSSSENSDDGKRLPKNETAGLCRSQRSGEEKSRRSGGGRKFRP